MSYTEKIDVLDLIINILKDHEEKLDALITRLEAVAPAGELEEAEEDPEDLDKWL